MNTLARLAATPKPAVCSVCRRRAVWLGYAPSKPDRMPVIWLCDDNGCHGAAKKIYTMPPSILEAYELSAMLEGGKIAGRYLEEIGNTDIAKLDREQWREFLRRLLTGYERALRRKVFHHELPF
jgi:hypothetical protein